MTQQTQGYGITPEDAEEAKRNYQKGWEEAPEGGFGIDLAQADDSEYSQAWNGQDPAPTEDEEKDAKADSVVLESAHA